MYATISKFLLRYYDPKLPVLLGLSGGPDSLALLTALMAFAKQNTLRFGIAHIDHGWREESAFEAQQLQKMAETLGIPFHLKKLTGLKGNLETESRYERLRFFKALALKEGYQAVLLGHHRDDQAETILKRFFEGANLCALSGMHVVTQMDTLVIWRPLLSIPKKEILEYIEQSGYTPFTDRTNTDPRFLRGRMRTEIIPNLSKTFGKEIGKNMCYIGKEIEELSKHIDQEVVPYLSKRVDAKFGAYLDLSDECPKSPFILKHLIRAFCKKDQMQLSRESLDLACSFVLSKTANRQLISQDKTLHIDRMRLFVPKNTQKFEAKHLLFEGTHTYGMWHVRVKLVNAHFCACTNWENLWREGGGVVLPLDDYQIGPAKVNVPYPRSSSLSKWWTCHKIPAFLRDVVPVIWKNEEMVHEFLTGKNKPLEKECKKFLKIELSCAMEKRKEGSLY